MGPCRIGVLLGFPFDAVPHLDGGLVVLGPEPCALPASQSFIVTVKGNEAHFHRGPFSGGGLLLSFIGDHPNSWVRMGETHCVLPSITTIGGPCGLTTLRLNVNYDFCECCPTHPLPALPGMFFPGSRLTEEEGALPQPGSTPSFIPIPLPAPTHSQSLTCCSPRWGGVGGAGLGCGVGH